MSLATPPAIHLDPIVTPGSNETISIVIPLSAQLATISRKNLMEQPGSLQNADSSCQKMEMKPLRNKVKGCPFPTCSRYGHAFSRAHDLKRHIARHESRKERLSDIQQTEIYTCPQCNQTFVTEAGFQQHMQAHFKQNDPQSGKAAPQTYSCQICRKKYTNENKLKVHLLAHKKKPDDNTCALCGTRFELNVDFQNHMKDHTESILQAQAALQHSSLHQDLKDDDKEDSNFLLEEMLQFKKDSRHLIDRMPSNTSKKSGANIRCNYCFKTFKTKWTLNCHVAAHEGRFQFDCRKCGKKFVRKSHYEGHVRSHEPARPYSCDQCGKSFKELKHRREHTKRKHPNATQGGVQTLLDNISACVGEEQSVSNDQAKLTILMPMNFPA